MAAALAPALLALAFDAAGAGAPVPDSTSSSTATHRSVFQRATHMTWAFVSDVGYVAASPTRMTLKGAVLTGAVIGATLVVYRYDDEIREGFFRSQGDPVYDAVLDVGNDFVDVGFMGGTWPYWVGGALVGTAFSVAPLQSVCLDVIESHLISGGVRNLAKIAIGREHPFEADKSSFFKKGTSMPSGHTSVVFEVATIFTRHTEGMPTAVRWVVGVTSYGIATSVAMQRVDSSAHWPSDVLIGGTTGAVIANTVVNRNQERRRNEGLAAGPRLEPWLGARGERGVVLAWSF